jgi:ribosome maturation factor RimP
MTTRRRKIQEKARVTAAPIIAEMGLEIVDVEFLRRDGSEVLCFYLDRPGGIGVDDLKEASRAIENILEVTEIVDGRYRLEVSSPGIDRPLRSKDDFTRHRGSLVKIRLFEPLPDGARSLAGVIVAVKGEHLILRREGEDLELSLPLDNIARAKPQIDWQALLKGTGPAGGEAGRSGRVS